MGNSTSHHKESHVFQKELSILTDIINNIINENNIFKNSDYNFLSKDVCDNYQVILEEELTKHLKLSIKSLGTSLYIIPKNDEKNLTKMNLSKKEVCEKISNHYIKILYILSLIKYVYNIEKDGDMSIAGIIIRNIRILDDIMEINFCDAPHRDYKIIGKKSYKLNFGKLEGFNFFVDNFLDKNESCAFLGVLKSILARSKKQKVSSIICHYIANKNFNAKDIEEMENLYMNRFSKDNMKEQLVCDKQNTEDGHIISSKHNISLNIFINNDNPIFAKEYCLAPRKILVKLSTTDGKEIKKLYNKMKKNYDNNISRILDNLYKIVERNADNTYTLKDLDKMSLDIVIDDVKLCIKSFYIQSIIDYQNLLDKSKLIPNIEFNK